MKTLSNPLRSLSRRIPLGLASLLILGTGHLAQASVPTDNPIATHYGTDAYPWADEIRWDSVHVVTDYGAVPGDGADDLAAIHAAITAAHAAGGGVVFFPPGVYHLSGDLRLRTGVVLRGAAPAAPAAAATHERGDSTLLDAPAQRADFLPPARLQFPRYEFDPFNPTGTPNDTAFKVITVEDEATTANWGLVHLDIDHARIRNYVDVWPSGPFELANRALGAAPDFSVRNIILYGLRGNHMVAPDPRIPSGSQHAWQRFPARGSSHIALMAYENVLVANNRLNDNITDDFDMPGYLLANGSLPNKPSAQSIRFRYTNVYGININRVYANPSPSPSSLTPDTFPEVFRKGIVARDNWLYSTSRVGYHITGQDAVIIDNVKVDDPDKFSAVMPEGTRQTAGSDTNENRGVDFSGFNVTVSGNDLNVYSHFAYLSNRTINGTVDGEAILNQAHTTAIVRGAYIENNYVKGYIGIYKTGDSEDIVIRRNRIRPGSLTRQNNYQNIYVVADVNNSPNRYLRNVLIEENWLTSNDDVTVFGTGGVENVVVRNNIGGNQLRYSTGTDFFGNAFALETASSVDFPFQPRPTVTLSGLADRSTVAPGSDVTLTADVVHADPIERVEFWSNGAKLGEATEAPYTLHLSDIPEGTQHNVYAKAVAENGRWNWSMLSIAFRAVEGAAPPVVPPPFRAALTLDTAGAHTVRVPTEVGYHYILERSDDLVSWTEVGTLEGTGEEAVLTDSSGEGPLTPGEGVFYRVEQRPLPEE